MLVLNLFVVLGGDFFVVWVFFLRVASNIGIIDITVKQMLY